MKSLLNAINWRLHGNYDRYGPVTEEGPARAQNRAKYEVWKYNTFGPGKSVYGKDYAYQIVDSGELSGEPLYVNEPLDLAALASIIAEMEGHREIAFREPRVLPQNRQSSLEVIAGQETRAIDRAARYFQLDQEYLGGLVEKLKKGYDTSG